MHSSMGPKKKALRPSHADNDNHCIQYCPMNIIVQNCEFVITSASYINTIVPSITSKMAFSISGYIQYRQFQNPGLNLLTTALFGNWNEPLPNSAA